MRATEALVLSAIQNLAATRTRRFTELVRLTPLDPARDFRFADLSGVDLRGEDLSSFDLSFATFDGARTIGAKFDSRRVSRRRLSRSNRTARAIVILVGEALLAEESYVDSELGLDAFMPKELNEAFRQAVRDTERRRQRTGIHFGDNSDLVRKRLPREMRRAREDVLDPSIVLVEPGSDFDFDVLTATLATLERQRSRPVVMLLPRLMSNEPNGEAILRARTRALDSANTISIAGTSPGPVRDAARLVSYATADRAAALGFITALTSANVLSQQTFRQEYKEEVDRLELDRASRQHGEDLGSAVQRLDAARRLSANTARGARRRLVLIREDAFTSDDPSRIATSVRRDTSELQVATFPRRAEEQVELYSVAGPRRSHIWSSVARHGRVDPS